MPYYAFMPPRSHPRYTRWTYLRRTRLNAGKTLAELATEAGYSYPHMCQIEQGRAGPSDDGIARLAKALGVPPAELDRTKPTVPPKASSKPAPRRPGITEAAHKEVA